MPHHVHALASALPGAATFEEAARLTFQACFGVVEDAIDAGDLSPGLQILHGIVHLRPSGDYRGLYLEPYADPGARSPHSPQISLSASAWTWIQARRAPAVVHTREGSIRPLLGPAAEGARTAGVGAGTLDAMRSRDATHAVVVPLRGVGGALCGAISLELLSDAGDLRSSPQGWGSDLQLAADVATAHLLGLPATSAPALDADPLMPVVGHQMTGLMRLLRVFAGQDETILVTGPTGAGKSRLARWIHARSRRADGPFESAHLHTMSEDMQLANLFGWRRGAFTGASRDQVGFVGRAHGGTLFIDEIGKLPRSAQTGLLELLETREYRALGDGGAARRADVRFVIGTNTDLRAAVEQGRFLEDLYYRINVLPVAVPALRERRDEIADWARLMAHRRHRDAGLDDALDLAASAIQALEDCDWPGNLRQLDNVVRRAYAMALADERGGGVRIEGRHVAHALGLDIPRDGQKRTSNEQSGDIVDAIDLISKLMVEEARRRHAAGAPLSLDAVEGLVGLVIHRARVALGDLGEAYRLLGRERAVESRNHTRDFRRRVDSLAALVEAFDLPIDAELRASLDG